MALAFVEDMPGLFEFTRTVDLAVIFIAATAQPLCDRLAWDGFSETHKSVDQFFGRFLAPFANRILKNPENKIHATCGGIARTE